MTIDERLLPSATPLVDFTRTIPLPRKLSGVRMLDIGSGQCIAPSWLGAQGALVAALDVRYRDCEQLESDMNVSAAKLQQMYAKAGRRAQWPAYLQQLEQDRASWRADKAANHGRYIAGSAFDVPFANGAFNIVYSINCITHGIGANPAQFERAVQEGWRVMEPGALFYIYPRMESTLRMIETIPSLRRLVPYTRSEQIHHDTTYRICIRKPLFER